MFSLSFSRCCFFGEHLSCAFSENQGAGIHQVVGIHIAQDNRLVVLKVTAER